MVESLFLYLALAFIWTHELDALARHEWRMMPLLARLADVPARRVFLWAHVPLMVLTLWLVAAGPDSAGAAVLAGFCVIHTGLHWLMRNHPANELGGAESWALILGAGGFGALFLLVQLSG